MGEGRARVSEELERAIGHDRRTFIKRLVIGTAFAAPVVSSVTMGGVQALFGSVHTGLAAPNTTPVPEEAPAAVVVEPNVTG
jgi:hypothetical protein